MNYQRAIQMYQQTKEVTLPMTEYVIRLITQLLEETLRAETKLRALQIDACHESLIAAQTYLFELMSVTDRSTTEGERLFLFYFYLNQLLIHVQLQRSEEPLQQVKDYATELLFAWREAQQHQRQRQYADGLI